MVSSKINDAIQYKETKTIDPEDAGYASTLYEMNIHEHPVEFVLGKQKYTYSGKNVLYYPIYLVNDDTIKSQIGVFEIETNHSLNILDKDGDIDLAGFSEPLFFSFVTPAFIQRATVNHKNRTEEIAEESAKEESESVDDHLTIAHKKNNDDELSLPRELQTTKKADPHSMFETDTHYKTAAFLPEESEEDADREKLAYKKSSKNQWIEDYMKNNHYDIVETEQNGDCFFAVIREAFKQIGQTTTVEKLRSLVAAELTDSVFQEHLNLYNEFQREIDEYTKELESMKSANELYAKRARKNTSKTIRDAIIDETQKLKSQYKAKMTEKKNTEALQTEYVGYMKNIKTIDHFRDYIKTSGFWADAWTISTMERLLNVKFVILSEESYEDGDFAGVLNCGELNRAIEERGIFNPDYYIMTTYSGNHYRLITYKHKRILTFREIPYGLKILAIKKCLEKNAGVYWLIQDFRNAKAAIGISPDAGKPASSLDEEDEGDSSKDSDLYDKDVKLMFHAKSQNKAKPGKGSGEEIPKAKVGEYTDLAKNKDWRRKLDDTWADIVFTEDHHKWASVEHYMQYAKYKKGFPDFAEMFSLDSGSEFSKDPAIARKAGMCEKIKNKILRPSHVKADPDFDLGRSEEERKRALRAKFSQNEDVKQILLATHRAQLTHYTSGEPAKIDVAMMRARHELSTQN